MDDWRLLEPPPVGVRVLAATGETRAEAIGAIPVYQGVSYCDAVRRAGEGETLRVLPGSLQVCGWAPVVLGLKQPSGRFEEGLEPRLAFPAGGLLLAPLDRFPGEPDLVLVRGTLAPLQEMVRALGPDHLWNEPQRGGHQRRLDRSAVVMFDTAHPAPGQDRSGAARSWTVRRSNWTAQRSSLISSTNRALAALARFRRWQALTRWLFRYHLVTVGFDALISRTMADMSVCRNSTAIPLLSGRANLSFFCTGGITWGRNRPDHLTSGWPWPQFQQAMQAVPHLDAGPNFGGVP